MEDKQGLIKDHFVQGPLASHQRGEQLHLTARGLSELSDSLGYPISQILVVFQSFLSKSMIIPT